MFIKKQIAAIVLSDRSEITLNFVNVQTQSGTCDCGLFALAFATSIANGIQIAPERQQFDQGQMRKHLHKCFEKRLLTPFPVKKQRVPKKVTSMDTIPVYCNCRIPEDDNMVQCSQYGNEWFHVPCADVPKAALDDSNEAWYCNIRLFSTYSGYCTSSYALCVKLSLCSDVPRQH